MEELFTKMFSNPLGMLESLKNLKNFSESSDKIIENNIKFHKACVAYNQAIVDMTEAISDNKKLIKNK